LVLSTTLGIASEPLNNNPPWSNAGPAMHLDMSVFNGPGQFSGFEGITPSGDIDYFMVSCGPNAAQGRPKGIVTGITLNFTHSVGDVDMFVYNATGTQIASSTSTTNQESVNIIAQNLAVVVVKVVGYAGAVNPSYMFTSACG
jgi:hypothetical protein